ncbi:MAG: hypothetical protein Q9218_001223 [Villophora microphyllina]
MWSCTWSALEVTSNLFVALGKELKDVYGHRVRLATHGTFKRFVQDSGLELFSIGGDPAELMAFMVKNPGLIPGMDSLKSGDVGKSTQEQRLDVINRWKAIKVEMGREKQKGGSAAKGKDDRKNRRGEDITQGRGSPPIIEITEMPTSQRQAIRIPDTGPHGADSGRPRSRSGEDLPKAAQELEEAMPKPHGIPRKPVSRKPVATGEGRS